VFVLPPSVTGAVNIVGPIPSGTVSFSVQDPNCQTRGLALNSLVSPTTYQATCTTSFTSVGPQTVSATYTSQNSTTASSTGSIVQTVVAGQIVTFGPTTVLATNTSTRGANSTTSVQSNSTTASQASGAQIYLVIINFQYCINAVQWAQYRQNLVTAIRVAVSVIQVITDPTFTCAPAKRQSAQRSTAVVGFSDLATAQAAVNAINGGQVQGIPGFPDPTAVLASGAGSNGGGLSGGQIAGIVVGSILGFILIVALIVIAFILGRKQGGGSEMSGRA